MITKFNKYNNYVPILSGNIIVLKDNTEHVIKYFSGYETLKDIKFITDSNLSINIEDVDYFISYLNCKNNTPDYRPRHKRINKIDIKNGFLNNGDNVIVRNINGKLESICTNTRGLGFSDDMYNYIDKKLVVKYIGNMNNGNYPFVVYELSDGYTYPSTFLEKIN